MNKKKDTTNAETASFVKEVARYFMNFLETDFKKRRIPKRNVIQKTQKGLRVGIDLEKYPKLKKTFFSLLNSGFKKEELRIKKGSYVNNIPKNLFNLIEKRVGKFSKKDIDKIFKEIEVALEEKKSLYTKEYDKFLEESQEETKNIFSRNLIISLLEDLDKPLENLDIADENSKFQLEIDITDSVFAVFEDKYTEVLQNFFRSKKSFNLKKELQKIIKLAEIKSNLVKFFENFVIGDAFFDIFQLYRNNKLIDKTEIYIYFYELALGNEKFPVFYLPITIVKNEDNFVFQFEKRIFVNTKAIDFVVQEFNSQADKKSTLAGEFDRILYINGDDNFYLVLKNYIAKIENFFELNKNIDLENFELQKGMNLIASFSNKGYLFLFDKSDEALINDYEEILNDDGEIIENFSSLLNGFIEENPKAFMEEVEDEWHEQAIPEKLVFESPVPLNDEQKQVLMALQKPDCNFMILEGPPGTGKSHTITAIICKALLEKKSVLVLSDKKEALDVVEEKIADTLNKVRHEDDFQNPILRLGKAGNKFYRIVQGQAINKIKEHYSAYKHRKGEYDKLRENEFCDLEKNIKENIDYFDNINIEDVEFYFTNFEKFSKFNWINSLEENKIDLLRIRSGIERLRNYDGSLKVDIKLLNDSNFNLLREYQNSLEALGEIRANFKKENKNIDINSLINEFDNHVPYEEKVLRSLTSIQAGLLKLDDLYKNKLVISELFSPLEAIDLGVLMWRSDAINFTLTLFADSKKFLGKKFKNYDLFSNFEIPKNISSKKAVDELKNYVDKLNEARLPVVGFLFKNKEVEKSTRDFKKVFNYFDLDNPKSYIKDLQQVSDLFDFIYNKIPDKYREKNDFDYFIWRLLIDLLSNDNEKYLADCREIQKIQKKITEERKSIYSIFKDIDNLDYEIQQVNLNIKVFEQIHKIKEIINKLEEIIPNKIKIKDNIKCKEFFSNDITKSLNKVVVTINEIRDFREDVNFIIKIKEKYPDFCERIKLKISNNQINQVSSVLSDYKEGEIEEYLKYKALQFKLEEQFNHFPGDKFASSIGKIEDLTTARMTYFLDKRIIEYTNNCAGEVQTLKNIVRRKQKFPKDLFRNLEKAFPCILAGIRDYAEFIPLEKNLFDLIIIDEASQVSVAQALPALIRGKQVIVLGDDKQFSNVKANNASKVTNQELRKKVKEAFLTERLQGKEKDTKGWLAKVDKNFDIKNSILKFSRFIRNYECQLKKHFRCYPEIISYSDKYFYDNTLQCMKIRGKKIEDVIKIEVIEHDGKFDESKNTNELEARHIVKKLKEFKKIGTQQSIGIITPHREQVTLLFDKINELPERDWLFGKCKLKIMTFDTCQGEERDYIFYSMVATKEKDRLNWIFLKDFSSISDEIDGTIKSQRMNVGFSRAKECMHFVLSKPIEEFQGEIKNAMLHYQNELIGGRKKVIKQLDSKMEYKVEEIFYNTKFYKDNKEKIEFIPQFELGKYLKQLDRYYNHPNYRVDFLLIYNEQKIIIEYDGFKEHFMDRKEVNEFNYKYYMKDCDVYRQKILEGYGYKFLRINRFNIGVDPVKTLDNRLQNLVKKNFKIK
jgi:very-short-patch-repair endonuclease